MQRQKGWDRRIEELQLVKLEEEMLVDVRGSNRYKSRWGIVEGCGLGEKMGEDFVLPA